MSDFYGGEVQRSIGNVGTGGRDKNSHSLDDLKRTGEGGDVEVDLESFRPDTEPVSDRETEAQVKELAELIWQSWQNPVIGRKIEKGLPLSRKLVEIADKVGWTLRFSEHDYGVHTLGAIMKGEVEVMKEKLELEHQMRKMLDNEDSYTEMEWQDKERREELREVRQELRGLRGELQSLDAESGYFSLNLTKRLRKSGLQKRLASLEKKESEVAGAISTPFLPESTHDLDTQIRNVDSGVVLERDCKLPTVVLGFLLDHLRKEQGLSIQVRFVSVRTFPHQYVEVVFEDEGQRQRVFFDYPPKAMNATQNNPDIVKWVEFDEKNQGKRRPVVRYYEVDHRALKAFDESFLEWTKKS